MSGALPVGAPRIAIFVDYENVKGRERVRPHAILEAIKKDVSVFGIVASAKVYLALGRINDPTILPQATLYEIYKAGGEPVTVPSFVGGDGYVVKSLVDPELICDLTEDPYVHPGIGVYCVASGDKDMLSPIRRLRRNGKSVRLYAPEECAAILASEVEGYADSASGVVKLPELLGSAMITPAGG